MACNIPTQDQHLPPSCRCPCYHSARHHSFFIFTVAVLVTLSISTTLAFGAINPLPSSSRGYHRSNSMGSSQSSLERSSEGGAATSADGDKNSVQLSASQNSNGDGNSVLINGGHNKYTPPSHPIKPLAHYIFLVHGWLGNDLEMAYLSKAFRAIISPLQDGEGIDNNTNGDSMGSIPDAKRPKRSSSRITQQLLAQQQAASERSSEGETMGPEIVVHSVKCNVGKTHDGIRNGGTRLANEIIGFIRKDVQKRVDENDENDAVYHDVTYSIVGNSLGGLYARYAVSLLPYQLHLQQPNPSSSSPSPSSMLNLHPNVFCTTATPHLGVSRHTYLPIPRIAETIIGAGMGTTGRDLFRLNSEKDVASAAAGGLVNAAFGGVRRLSALRPGSFRNLADDDEDANGEGLKDIDDEEMECIIRNMCLRDKYLMPLRNFRQRIAYANAYGTDFQVPTETAAFLNLKSGVGHFVISSRHIPGVGEEKGSAEGSTENKGGDDETSEERPFIVAVVLTEQTSQPQSPTKRNSNGDTPSDELIQMSQSLDALGWTKVFIDVRDRIPVRGLAKPAWLRPQIGSLDDLIRERAELQFQSLQSSVTNNDSTTTNAGDASRSSLTIETSECILTSQELAQSTHAGDSINFPLGHTVMVANSKNEGYSKLNSQGRPVMDKLAEDMIDSVLGFE